MSPGVWARSIASPASSGVAVCAFRRCTAGSRRGSASGSVGDLRQRGRPATITTTTSARSAMLWCSRPAWSTKARAIASVGITPRPTSFETRTSDPAKTRHRRRPDASSSACTGRSRHHEVGQPQRQAVDQHGAIRRHSLSKHAGKIERLLDGAPSRAAPLPVRRDPRRHLLVQRLGGRDIHGRKAALQHQPLGMAALAGTRATEDQCQAVHRLLTTGWGMVAALRGGLWSRCFLIGHRRRHPL